MTYLKFQNLSNLLIASIGFLYLVSHHFASMEMKFFLSFLTTLFMPMAAAAFFLANLILRIRKNAWKDGFGVNFILNVPAIIITFTTWYGVGSKFYDEFLIMLK